MVALRAFCIGAVLVLAACQTVPSGNTFCDIAKPIRPTASQVDAMTDAQVRELLAHNQKGAKLCGWRP